MCSSDLIISEQEALQLALANARDEMDVQVEAARLAAARRQALDALVADLRNRVATRDASLADMLARLDSSEQQAVSLTAQLAQMQVSLSREETARPERRTIGKEVQTWWAPWASKKN